MPGMDDGSPISPLPTPANLVIISQSGRSRPQPRKVSPMSAADMYVDPSVNHEYESQESPEESPWKPDLNLSGDPAPAKRHRERPDASTKRKPAIIPPVRPVAHPSAAPPPEPEVPARGAKTRAAEAALAAGYDLPSAAVAWIKETCGIDMDPRLFSNLKSKIQAQAPGEGDRPKGKGGRPPKSASVPVEKPAKSEAPVAAKTAAKAPEKPPEPLVAAPVSPMGDGPTIDAILDARETIGELVGRIGVDAVMAIARRAAK